MALKRRTKDAQSDFFPGFADVAEIGSGTLSTTYRAREIATDRWLALKLLTVSDVSSSALETFDREAITVGELSAHPNIVSLHGSFRAPDGRPVRVLELCSASVAELMSSAGSLPVRDVVSLGVKIAAALETAHRAGLLHRDVNPQNILVSENGQPALDDFGLATLQPAATVTAARSITTALHHAPEQFVIGDCSPATDVYGLASTLYQLVAGQPAFHPRSGEPHAAVIQRIVADPVPPLTDRQAPPRLSDLLVYSMSKDKTARPPTAAEFAKELGAVEAEQQWPRTEFLVRDAAASPPAPGSAAQSGRAATGSAPAGAAPAGEMPGWTPPAADSWFSPGRQSAGAPRPALPSTEWSEPTRSAPRHARPDDDDNEPSEMADADADVPVADVPVETDVDGLTDDQYAAFEAAASHAPPTTVNPVRPSVPATRDAWSDVSLSTPPPAPDAAPPPDKSDYPHADGNHADGTELTVIVDTSLGIADPGKTTAHPVWRQAQAAAAATEAADAAAGPSGAELAPASDVPAETMARYPIPPVTGETGEQSREAVPAWAFREPAQAAAAPSFGDDLTLDPMSLRRRLTIRSGGHAVVIDDGRLLVRAWLRRTEIAWPDVLAFEPRFDGVGDTGSGGRLVAITRNGPIELPATKRSMADLRYVQALLEAYRHRAQMTPPN